MGDSIDIIKNFEKLLKQNVKKEPLALYSDQNTMNAPGFQGQTSHIVQDVISKVSKQIKAIQKADIIITSRKNREKLEKYKQSSFVPVNILPIEEEVPIKMPASKFETQFVSDTQLINLIDNAEALANNGITQEFDCTFSQTDIERNDNTDENMILHEEDKTACTNDNANTHTDKNDLINKDNGSSVVVCKEFSGPDTITVSNEIRNCDISLIDRNKDVTEYNSQGICTELLNQCMEIETNINELNTEGIDDEEIQPSLVFEAKKSKTPSPLVFDLSAFENFEKIALPIIEENTDFNSAKHLVNSQILGKELFIQTNMPHDVNPTKEQISPVLQISAERLKITKTDHTNIKSTDDKNKGDPVEIYKENDDTFLKDEILFSSDEENEYVDKEFQDIPLTCALETSFYDQPEVLDKTMYVGFQTASNRSIQISREAFSKAQSLLHEAEKDISSKVTLTDLFESLSVKNTSNTAYKDFKTTSTRFQKEETDHDSLVEKEIHQLKRPDKRKFEGFVTASRKKIKLSDMALARCKRVFQDIDVGAGYDIENETEIRKLTKTCVMENFKFETISKNPNENKIEINPQIDDDIIKEFANDMSLLNNRSLDIELEVNVENRINTEKAPNKKFFDSIDFSDSILEDYENYEAPADMNLSNDKGFNGPFKTKNDTNSVFIAFKTASNNQIKISSKAIEKAKSVFQDINLSELEEINPNSAKILSNVTVSRVEDFDKPSTSKCFSGIQTVSNKFMNVSDEPLVKSKSILKDIIDNVCEHQDTNISYSKNLKIDPETAGKENISSNNLGRSSVIKVVPIQNENKTLDAVKAISDKLDAKYEHVKGLDDDFNEASELIEIEKNNSLELCAFKSASNKPLVISNRALAQSEHVFKDLEVDLNFDNERLVQFPAMIKKCQTDIDVKLLFHKLPESKSFENVSHTENSATSATNNEKSIHLSRTSSHVQSIFLGFRTASSKPIDISNEALAKSKEFFKDTDKENDLSNAIKDENKEANKVSQSHGFKTGNKNPIRVSARALAKSKETFKDIDESSKVLEEFDTKQLSGIKSFSGFQTANNKPIKVSAKALARCKALFKDIDEDDNYITNALQDKGNESGEKNDTKIKEDIFTLKGFQTAGNKSVTISNDALAQSKALFQDTASKKPVQMSAEVLARSKAIFKDIDKEIHICKESNLQDGFEFKGFQTASEKPVTISKEAMARSKDIFKDIHEVSILDSGSSKEHVPKFIGFQTASKKPVEISEAALAKSKAVFKDIDKDDIIQKNIRGKDKNFKGFETASRKLVHISEDALTKSKAIFMDQQDIVRKNIKENTDSVPKFKGFETASRKPVRISEEALAKSKALFMDIDQQFTVGKNIKENTDSAPKFKGFETASRKPVRISEEALAKSKALFMDIDQQHTVGNNIKENTDKPKFNGFETASRKPVQISDEALAKSKKLFKDIDDEIVLNQNSVEPNDFLKSQTTSNKSVKTTDDLARSKRVFDDNDGLKDLINDEIPFKGFETASNKKVKISEQALKKSREIFQDINLKHEGKENLVSTQATFAFQTGNNDEVKFSEKALKDSKKLLRHSTKPNNLTDESETAFKEDNHIIEKLIDTQVMNNFEQTLNTEDFNKETPKQSKRSGSPILSCPRAKRRKFNTPYRSNGKTPNIKTKTIPKHEDTPTFNDDYKKTKRYTLKDLAKVELTSTKLKPDPYILKFNIDTILNIEFVSQRNGITDGDLLVNGLKEYFLTLVNKKLVPDGWLDIQIKLILWKLISYEVKFPNTLNRVCTAKNVIEQLKYRYDKELYNVERPVLRKILEKDDVPSKTMVLCVAAIFVDGVNVTSVTNISSNVELLLTDGWYLVKAIIDKMLTKLVYDEKITVGCKLVINGAELMNCDQGIAPWEDTSSVRLKLSGNSTRRARWDARLGRHGNAAILSALSSVKPEGGKVSRLRLYVTRVYPMLYVEKFEDGSTVTRSERLENIHQIKYETDRQIAMEKLYEEVEKDLSDQESQESDRSQLKNKKNYGSMITESQTKLLEDKSNRDRERLLQNIQERVRKKIVDTGLDVSRNVVTLLKIRVAGVEEKNGVVVTKGCMSIWKPNDMLTEIIKENTWIEVLNVVPTAIRYSEIQLSAGRQTVFKPSNFKENDKIKPYLKTLGRKCFPVGDLAQKPTMTTEYNEIDTVGFIFQIDDESTKQPFQNMYLSDGDKHIICVNFWGGLRKFGFQNVLDTGQIVSCKNLQKRAGNTRKSIPQFRVTEFTCFTKTPKSSAARNILVEIEKKISSLDKNKYCDECIKLKNNYSNYKCLTENVSPYRFNDLNLTKNKMFIDSPLIPKREELNLTGLDFESTFRQTDTQELSPKTKERKKKVNEKIARLKMIGEPPPLSPMNIINKSKNAFNSYKSPLAHTIVASPKKTNEISRTDIQSSPIIQMNKTYVRNVNPVKLNFSNMQENSIDEVDHFAEEFDGSPPLSLE